MRTLFIAIAFAFLLPHISYAQKSKITLLPYHKLPAGDYVLDLSHTSVIWKVSHFGLSNYTARFTKISGTLNFDPKDITKSKIRVVIDPLSLKTDYPFKERTDFDKKLSETASWFNAKRYPEITFHSNKIEKINENTGKVHGTLMFLGIKKPVVLNVKFNGGYLEFPFAPGPIMGFSATAKLKRSDWGFKQYLPNIGDEVSILIESEFQKK